MPQNFLEEAKLYLPGYLAPTSKADLYSGLSRYPENIDYFIGAGPEDVLQADAYFGFTARNFSNNDTKQVNGIVISNSCDISPANNPPNTRLVLFAPLISIESLQDLWRRNGREDHRIQDELAKIRAQKLTEAIYFPAAAGFDESVAFLDQIQSQPLGDFLRDKTQRLFRLSNIGFYIFIIKLSIHFTRLWEGVDRVDNPV